jgi:uncharacterized protein (DUF608 family)
MAKLPKSCQCEGVCTPKQAHKHPRLNRRDFMQSAAAVGGASFLANLASEASEQEAKVQSLLNDEMQQVAQSTKEAATGRYAQAQPRSFNGPYGGANLNRVAFPIGGLGAGMFCLEGTGALSHMSVRNKMEFFHEPCSFAALCVKGSPNAARVLEGPIPDWKFFGGPGTGNGSAGADHGLPRFAEAAFLARFPFGTVSLRDEAMPLEARLTGWSPFIPGNADDSSLPLGALEYTFNNTSKTAQDAVFSFNTKNFMAHGRAGNYIAAHPSGFILGQDEKAGLENTGGMAVFVEGDTPVVDHCWFKGGWWDALTLAWRNVADANLLDNPPQKGAAPGASLFVPFKLAPGKEKTIRLLFAWYVPKTSMRVGTAVGNAFECGPSDGAIEGQQAVTDFEGEGLVNTFDPHGDGAMGKLRSPRFEIARNYIHFLVGGGKDPNLTGVRLLAQGKVARKAAGRENETLAWESWDVRDLKGERATIEIIDQSQSGWGHINVDHIIMSDAPLGQLRHAPENKLRHDDTTIVLADFEGDDYGDWKASPKAKDGETPCCSGDEDCATPAATHAPWYAGQFEGLTDVATYWKKNYDRLRAESALFRDTFYDTTLPPEVVEAVAANLTILKSPTVMRQLDGRLWSWEGCGDNHGCCHGSCTHVWNYAQAIAHLFPELERTLRHTEFSEAINDEGGQAFRVNLPISPTQGWGDASDGQLGGIMKMYREWRISGDTEWLRKYWPGIKLSLDHMIKEWDPRDTGLLEESHHNTYDINYFGPDGHCGSFYLGALTAAAKMGDALGDDVSRYAALRDKGVLRLEKELYNGEYFYQKIMKDELDNPFKPLNEKGSGPGYQATIELLNQQGPKYQYGTGCLSDGVLGFWIARMCGLDDDIADPAKVRSNLKAIHTHNLKHDLHAHANPQRPAFAMGNDGGLLLCTWPKGGALAIPFVYSDEVWTGIEYQVASHLMLEGMVDEGLEIVRLCRQRYDGVRRNPYNEYECGHWYARALSSYGLLQGLTGLRYDAIDKCLHLDTKVGDFRAFLSTNTGYGTVEWKNGKAEVDVKAGKIEIVKIIANDTEIPMT